MNPHEILPAPEAGPVPAEIEQRGEITQEAMAAKTVETAPGAVAGAGAVTAASVSGAQAQVVQSSQLNGQSNPSSIGASMTPLTADDVDLIEKEWVLRAKAIVAATIGDPYAQSQQLSRMKADYIKKRYNKDVKYKEDA